MSNQPQNISAFQNGIGSMPQTMIRPTNNENQGPTMNASSKIQQTPNFLSQSAQQQNYQYSATQAPAINGDHSTSSYNQLNKLQNASHQQIPQQINNQQAQNLPCFVGQKIPQNSVNLISSQSIASVPLNQQNSIYSNGPGNNPNPMQNQNFQQNLLNRNNGQTLPPPLNTGQQPANAQFNGTPLNSAAPQQYHQNQILPPGTTNSLTQNINTLIPNLQNITLAPPQSQPQPIQQQQFPPSLQSQMPQNLPLRTPVNNNQNPPQTSQFQNIQTTLKPAVRPMYPPAGTQPPPTSFTNNQMQYPMPNQQQQYKPPEQYPQQQQLQPKQQQINSNVYNGQQPPFGHTAPSAAPLQYQPQQSIVQSGFSKLWGHPDTIDLMQQRHILPHDGVPPPQISLNNQFSDSVNCDPE